MTTKAQMQTRIDKLEEINGEQAVTNGKLEEKIGELVTNGASWTGADDERKNFSETVAHLQGELKSCNEQSAYRQRELDKTRRMFMELYETQRTTSLRLGWLEEAATDAVNACEKHVEENMDRLRDELGLEMRGDA